MTQNLPLQATPASDRIRLSLELSQPVSQLLDHVVAVTGGTRSQVAMHALAEALPGLVERADFIRKRAREMQPPAQNAKKPR